MWRSVFLHEFIDQRITNFQALPGAPTPASLTLAPVEEAATGGRAVTIAPGVGFEHVLAQPLPQVIGVSLRVRMIYPVNPLSQMFPVIRLGAGAELLFWPVSDPLPDGSGTQALARVWVGSGFRNLGNVVLPAQRFAEIRFDWHASGQARLLIDGRLVAYHNATAAGAMFPVDRVAFGIPGMPAAPRPLYRVARVFVRVLERPDAMAHLSKLLPKTKPVPDQNRCRLRILGNALRVVERLRAFMAGTHQSLSQPWTAEAGPASGPFRPEAVQAHTLAKAAGGELVRMLRTGDFTGSEAFLDPFAAFLRILRDARPLAFAALAAEVDAMDIVPEECRALLEPSAEDREAFAAIGELLTKASDIVRSVAGGTDVADLAALQQFAADHAFGLTAPLNHARVTRLAEYWLPEMRFYWDERFHPVTLDDVFAMVEDGFARLPPEAQDDWRVTKFVRSGSGGAFRAFDPPVVHVPDGTVPVPAPQGGTQFRKVVRVLNEGTPARHPAAVGSRDRHGHHPRGELRPVEPVLRAARHHVAERHRDRGRPLEAARRRTRPGEPRRAPAPRYRHGRAAQPPRSAEVRADHRRGGGGRLRLPARRHARVRHHPEPAAPGDIRAAGFPSGRAAQVPAGGHRGARGGPAAPRAARGLAARPRGLERGDPLRLPRVLFLLRLQRLRALPDGNFRQRARGRRRGLLPRLRPRAARSRRGEQRRPGDPAGRAFRDHHLGARGVSGRRHPEVHPAPLPDPANPDRRARDVVDVTVYVAGGSHATYLTSGTHDLVDFQDTWGYVDENASWLYIVWPVPLAISIILAILEHFIDTEDFTSEEGVHAGPDSVVGEHPGKVAGHALVLPMSRRNHIYQPRQEALLALRAYAGKWGGQDGIVDKSPPFATKTGRYFRKLVYKL